MNRRPAPDPDEPPLRDPEFSSAPDPTEGVSRRKFLGVPAWVTAVAFALIAALMYLLLLAL